MTKIKHNLGASVVFFLVSMQNSRTYHVDPCVYSISGSKFFATSVRGFAVTEGVLLTSVFRTLVTADNEGDSEDGGV